jgi:polyisoprenoid-binding protein YceI
MMSKWKIDPDHSVAAFSIRHLEVAFVHGQMNAVSGTIELDPDDMGNMSIDLEIGISSIITGIGKRDDHLKSADFFDAEKIPTLSFKSTKVEITGDPQCRVSGDLAIHGITKSVALDVDFAGPVKSPFGETSIGLTGKIAVNREDYGVSWNAPLESGGFMVGKDVEVSVDIEADLIE